MNAGKEIFPFRVHDPLELLDLDPGAFGEPSRRVRRTSVGVERDSDGRTGQLAGLGLLAVRDAPHEKREPPRRGQRPHRREADAGRAEALPGQRLELSERGRDEPGRKLLAADLEKKRLRHGPAPPRPGLRAPPGRGAGSPAPPAA